MISTIAPAAAISGRDGPAEARVAYLDNLRYLVILLVVLYHAVGAYAATLAPYWGVHDTETFAAGVARELRVVSTVGFRRRPTTSTSSTSGS